MNKVFAYLVTFIFGSYSISQIENGMIAHLPFNSNLSDISSSAIVVSNSGLNNFITDRNGIPSYAIDFNGTGHVVLAGSDLKVNFPLTVSLWINLNSLSGVNTFFKTDNVYNNYYGVWINNLPTGGITLSFGGGLGTTNSSNQRYFTTSDNFITAGSWHHILGIIRSYNDMDLYIDCIKANGVYGGTGLTNVVYSITGEQWVGGTAGNISNPSGSNVDGAMDQFAFWNRELTPQEISYLCDTYNSLSVPELKFDHSEIVNIYDMMGRKVECTDNAPLVLEFADGSRKKYFKSSF